MNTLLYIIGWICCLYKWTTRISILTSLSNNKWASSKLSSLSRLGSRISWGLEVPINSIISVLSLVPNMIKVSLGMVTVLDIICPAAIHTSQKLNGGVGVIFGPFQIITCITEAQSSCCHPINECRVTACPSVQRCYTINQQTVHNRAECWVSASITKGSHPPGYADRADNFNYINTNYS